MTRFLSASLAILSAATTVSAFSPSHHQSVFRYGTSTTSTYATEDTDFDAPIPAYPMSGTAVLDHEPIVDDECYMGANGQLDECADFDPIHTPRTRSANAMDQARSAPKWTYADDFDAPVLMNPASASPLANVPVVDDECYMGADGGFDECVDFDPIQRPTRSVNAMDNARPAPKWAYADDFDAPVLMNPASASPLANVPVVDDECYMGANGGFDECVDFDPIQRPTRSVNAMDNARLAPKWAYADDFDAPVLMNPASASPLANEPVVDDECYMGADGGFDECVDFDPIQRPSRSVNAMDQSRTIPKWMQSAFAGIVKD